MCITFCHFYNINISLPTTVIGCLFGNNPKEYWKIPLPLNRIGNGHVILSQIFSCKLRTNDPLGFKSMLEKRESSPNEKVGTKYDPCFNAFFTNPFRFFSTNSIEF